MGATEQANWFGIPSKIWKWLEVAGLAGVLLAVNLPLFSGEVARSFMLDPQAVADGQWWRLLLHPFVHLSWYHLALDGIAFLLLWNSLDEGSGNRRWGYAPAATAGSIMWSLMTAGQVGALGLCGLSGTAHGLMAAQCLEMVADRGGDRAERLAGGAGLAVLTTKVAWEAATGKIFFGFLHFGYIGTPIIASHVGGLLGCLAMFAFYHFGKSPQPARAVAASSSRVV